MLKNYITQIQLPSSVPVIISMRNGVKLVILVEWSNNL